MFSPYQRPRIVEFPDPATGHITAGISVDSKSLEQSDIPALGTPITQIGLPEEFADKYSPEHVLTRILANEGSPGYQLIFEKLPGATLTGKVVTEKGQVATLTRQTVAPGTPVTASALTVTARLEPDGKGKSVLEKIEVPEVFPEKTLAAERPDTTPQKFQVAIPTATTEETVAGTAAEPTLGTGELAKSEQQVTEFTKRTRKVSRKTSKLPAELKQTGTSPEKLKKIVKEVLQKGDTPKNPSATIVLESEALGDGTYVVRSEDQVQIFSQPSFSQEVADVVPAKFRPKYPTVTEERTELGAAKMPSVEGEEEDGTLAKSEQQVDKFTKRTRKVYRDRPSLPVELTQTTTTNEGLKAKVTESLQVGDTDAQPSATSSVESEALGDGTYVVRTTELPEVFDGKSFSIENTDPVPPKFRITAPAVAEEKTVAGEATTPTLDSGELAASEQQLTKFTKRTRRVKRAASSLPKSFTQKATTNEGLTATVFETLQKGDTTEVPNATTTIESEALGDGSYLVRKTVVPEVFSGKTFSTERGDAIPEKFRVSLPTTVEETTLAGTAASPALGADEIAASEQQLTKFTKRSRRVKRAAAFLPASLSQTATTNEGLKATVTETLQEEDASDKPSATVSVESEALGDGKYLVRKTELPEVFSGEVFSKQAPDPLPAKFRATLETFSTEETVEGIAGEIALSAGDLEASEQQVTKFTKRVRKTSRDLPNIPTPLEQTATSNEGLKVKVTETLQLGDTTAVPSATVSVESEALGDGRYIVRTTELPKVFEGKALTAEKASNIPQKFLSAVQTTTEESTEEGQISAPSLNEDEIAASEQQVTEFTKRTRRVSRNLPDLPQDFKQTATTNEGLRATVTETLQTGDTAESPSATVSLESEALGDGKYLVRKTELPEVFSGTVYSKEKPEVLPAKFRAKLESITTEKTEVGDAGEITLIEGELAASEQQVTKFTKRTRRTSRSAPELPVSFEQTATSNEGLKVKVTETLQLGDTTDAPSAKISIESEALGDDNYLVRKTELPEIFPAKQVSAEKGDVLPEKFRAGIPAKTTEEIVEGEIVTEAGLTLGANDLAKSEQQLTKFTKRVRTTKRDAVETAKPLNGTTYDEVLNIATPYTEKVVKHESDPTKLPTGSEITPLSEDYALERTFSTEEGRKQLRNLYYTFPSQERVNLPDKLISLTPVFARGVGGDEGFGSGASWQWKSGSEASVTGDLVVEIEQGYAGLVPALNHVFYVPLDAGSLTDELIYIRTGSKKWPNIVTRSYNMVVIGQARQREASASRNGESRSGAVGFSTKALVNTVFIPPTIHGDIDIQISTDSYYDIPPPSPVPYIGAGDGTAVASVQIENLTGDIRPRKLKSTPQKTFPTGRYLLTSSVTPYRYGMGRVTAVTVDISSDYV